MGMLMAGPFLTGWSATMVDFKARCEQATDDADHRAVLVAADSLLRMAQAAGNSYYEAYGHYYQGVSNVLLGRAQQGLQQLRRAEQLAQTQHNDTLIVFIYNAYGIYEANKSNYAVARSYFYKSLTRALEQNDRLRQAKLELNLAEVAFLLKDTAGLAYARSAYEWAEANGNDEVMLVGAYQCANLSYLQRKPEEALRYLAKVKKLAEQGHYKEWSSIHKLYADVYLMMGRFPLVGGNDLFGRGGSGLLNNWAVLFVTWLSGYRATCLPEELKLANILLIIDGCTSHHCLEALDLFRRHNVTVLILPAHTSHLLQAFDVTIASTLKAYFRRFVGEEKKQASVQQLTKAAKTRLTLVRSFLRAWHASASPAMCCKSL